MEEQIQYCMNQLQRFSEIFKIKNTDTLWKKKLQFGYNLGRLTILLKKYRLTYPLNPNLSKYSIAMAKEVIIRGFNEKKYFEYNIMDFGFAVGFIQEFLNQSYFDWWKPISSLCSEEKWNIIEKLTIERLSQQNIYENIYYYFPVFCRENELVWSTIHDNIILANDKIAKNF